MGWLQRRWGKEVVAAVVEVNMLNCVCVCVCVRERERKKEALCHFHNSPFIRFCFK